LAVGIQSTFSNQQLRAGYCFFCVQESEVLSKEGSGLGCNRTKGGPSGELEFEFAVEYAETIVVAAVFDAARAVEDALVGGFVVKMSAVEELAEGIGIVAVGSFAVEMLVGGFAGEPAELLVDRGVD